MTKKFFLRISRFSDRDWQSYRLPEDHSWFSEEFSDLDSMLQAGAVKVDGLAGIEWAKPYFEDDDIIFPADSPVFEFPPEEDATAENLRQTGFILRVYAGEKLEDIQDGVIFRPIPLSDEEAGDIMEQYNVDIYPENYEKGLLYADGPSICRPEEIWDSVDWEPKPQIGW